MSDRPRRRAYPAYFVYLHLLFWSGMRPSEAAGLQWQDVDLERGLIHLRRSRHLWEYGDTKTEGARRSVQLFPRTIDLLRTVQPLRVTPEMPVFVNTLGTALEPNSLLPHWYACQRALGIRVRGLYCTKDTFVTTALYRMRETNQIDIPWLERQTGVQYQTLKKHYRRWWRDDGGRELRKFAAEYPELFQGRIVPPQKASGGTIGAGTRKLRRREVRKGGLEPGEIRGNIKEFQGPNRQEPPPTATNCVRRTHLLVHDGHCHLMNFGGFATPERTLVFDINDFDETLRAPFEWDLKRLAASFVVAARWR